jgi:hypothetical protein
VPLARRYSDLPELRVDAALDGSADEREDPRGDRGRSASAPERPLVIERVTDVARREAAWASASARPVSGPEDAFLPHEIDLSVVEPRGGASVFCASSGDRDDGQISCDAGLVLCSSSASAILDGPDEEPGDAPPSKPTFIQQLSRRGSSFYTSELDDIDDAVPLSDEPGG